MFAARAATGAVRYDICLDPARERWYLDASWKRPATGPITLAQARQGTVVAVDVNAGHLEVAVLHPDGNQAGRERDRKQETRHPDGPQQPPGIRPESPDGPRQATRRPKTVRGRPPGRTRPY